MYLDCSRTILSLTSRKAKKLKEEWSSILNDPIAETRPGQLGELYRRTERVFQEVEETALPRYKAYRPSLDEAVLQSETELEARAASEHRTSLKPRQELRGPRVRTKSPLKTRAHTRGSGPQLKTAPTSGREDQ
jgi:hypothetical protein